MRISAEEFRTKDLRVHSFLADVPLHDVTVLRLHGGGAGRTVLDFQALFSADSLQGANFVVAALFEFRSVMGGLFRWEELDMQPAQSAYLDRLTGDDRARSLVPPGNDHDISPLTVVYAFEHESLYQLRNATGHHFLAFAIEPSDVGYTLYWAVYVKRTSLLTPLYMGLIDPLRRFLVYPSIVKTLERAWEKEYPQ